MKKWLLCDFHIHSTFSDGTMEIKDIIDFYGNRNFEVIAITDHVLDRYSSSAPRFLLPTGWIKNKHEFNSYMRILKVQIKRAMEKYNMLVIPGIELTNYITNQHIVCLGIKEFIRPEVKMIETLKKLKDEQNIFTVAAHPHISILKLGGGSWYANGKLRPHIDAWEAGNGIDDFPHVLEEDLPFVANTDFHGEKRDNGINGWKSVVYAEKNINSITDAIRSKNVVIFKYFDGDKMESPEKYGWNFDELDE